jgi:hypothetical protein
MRNLRLVGGENLDVLPECRSLAQVGTALLCFEISYHPIQLFQILLPRLTPEDMSNAGSYSEAMGEPQSSAKIHPG